MSDFRKPITVLVVETERCFETYGDQVFCFAAIGTTGADRCYNTRATCQDPENYFPIKLKERYADSYYFDTETAGIDPPLKPQPLALPSIRDVAVSSARINISARRGRDTPLGRRAEAVITFADHPHDDLTSDPYAALRDYDPLSQGTYWPKWLARMPYHYGWSATIYYGQQGQLLSEMRRDQYVIESVARPDSNGRVTMRLVDPLALVLRDTTRIPPVGLGVLNAPLGIEGTSTSIQVAAGAGVYDYFISWSAAGPWYVRIEDEIMRFSTISYNAGTGITTLTMTSVAFRARFGTTWSVHDTGASVQLCFVPPAGAIGAAEQLLLKAGVSPSLIDIDDADTTCDASAITSGINTAVAAPTALPQLLGELAEQFGLLIWWDADLGKIRIRCNALPTTPPTVYTDRDHIIAGSMVIKELASDRISELWLHYDPRTPLRIGSAEDFKKVAISLPESNLYAIRQTAEIFSRWISSDVIAAAAADRVLAVSSRFQLSARFSLTPKDANIAIGDFIAIDHPSFQDASGGRSQIGWLVVSRHEDPPAEVIVVEAQTVGYDLDLRVGLIATDAAAENYADATAQERTDNAYMADDDGLVGGDPGYSIT